MRRGVRSLASAVSSFIASCSASCTNSLIAGSPQEPSEPRPKPPAKPLAPAMPTPSDLAGLAIEHVHADVLERVATRSPACRTRSRGCRAPPRSAPARRQFVGQHLGFLGGAVVGEVAAQQQRVGRLGGLGEEGAQGAGGVLGDVEVAYGGEAHVCRRTWDWDADETPWCARAAAGRRRRPPTLHEVRALGVGLPAEIRLEHQFN